jgi:DtxR family Mn-dependent transcriptional regulator
MELSKTEQDYVKVIYDLSQRAENELVSLKQLGSQLDVSAPSVTEMAKRIEKKGLVEYQSYKGVKLTPIGNEQALFILKAHRVWEYFLLDVLNYQEEDVHREAEALEHAVSPQLIERLYKYLGKPATCPHGRKIPEKIFWYEQTRELLLVDLRAGIRAKISNASNEFVKYLQKLGLEERPRSIKVKERLADGTCIVDINDTTGLVLPIFFQRDVHVIIYE